MEQELNFLYIYLTDECNLGCVHCWQSAPLQGKGKYSSLNFNECQKFLSDTVDMGLKGITFSGGEPLLNPDFEKFAKFLFDHNILMALETNAMLIAERINLLDVIRNCNIYCAISLDGVNAATHNRQRGNQNAFQRTMESIHLLEREKMRYQLIMSISKANYSELVPLLDWVKENCTYCDKFKINVINDLGRADKMKKKGLLFDPVEYPALSEEVSALVGQYPFQIILHVDPAFVSFKHFKLKFTCGGYCGYLSALSILANGNISICSLGKQIDRYIFGHITSIDVKDVWGNHPVLKDIHEDTQKKLKGVCAQCIFRKYCCGGCRAEALAAYGDFFGPHPKCQEYFESGKFPVSRIVPSSMQEENKEKP